MTGLGEMNPKIRGKMLQVAGGTSADQDHAVKATVTSQVTYDNEETGRERTSLGKDEAGAKVKDVEEKINSRGGSPEGASFACTEI